MISGFEVAGLILGALPVAEQAQEAMKGLFRHEPPPPPPPSRIERFTLAMRKPFNSALTPPAKSKTVTTSTSRNGALVVRIDGEGKIDASAKKIKAKTKDGTITVITRSEKK